MKLSRNFWKLSFLSLCGRWWCVYIYVYIHNICQGKSQSLQFPSLSCNDQEINDTSPLFLLPRVRTTNELLENLWRRVASDFGLPAASVGVRAIDAKNLFRNVNIGKKAMRKWTLIRILRAKNDSIDTDGNACDYYEKLYKKRESREDIYRKEA